MVNADLTRHGIRPLNDHGMTLEETLDLLDRLDRLKGAVPQEPFPNSETAPPPSK